MKKKGQMQCVQVCPMFDLEWVVSCLVELRMENKLDLEDFQGLAFSAVEEDDPDMDTMEG